MRKAPSAAAKKRPSRPKARNKAIEAGERYDANIDHILRSAAAVFAEKSFGLASIRDIAARARISFPRIYYYLRNKEELLYLISKRAFEQLLKTSEQRTAEVADPEAKLRIFIQNHLEYHMSNLAEMKVLVREADTLSGNYAADIARLKREYSRVCRRILEQIAVKYGKTLDRDEGRIVTSLMFGAMNWFYTWYDPARDYPQRGRIFDEVFRMVSAGIAAR